MDSSFDRRLTMDNPAAPAPTPGDADRDAGLMAAAQANRTAIAGQRNRYTGDVGTPMTGDPGPAVSSAPGGAPPAMAPMINPGARPAPTSLSQVATAGGDALSRLRASRPAAPAPTGPAMRPVAQPVQRPSYADLRLNPRSFANAQAVAAPRVPAGTAPAPVVAPRTAPLVPPAVLQAATPFDAGGYLRQSPDIADAYAQYQNGTLNEAARGWFDAIPEAAKVSPEAFAQWHYNNIGKNEPGRNPGGRVPGTL